MKADVIIIFSVVFTEGGNFDYDAIQECASPEGGFYLADSSAELVAGYEEIAVNLLNLRVSE